MNNSLTVLASNWGKLEKKLLPSTHKQQIHTPLPILCNLYLYDHYTARLNISNFDQNNIPLLPKPIFGSCKAEGMFVSHDGKTHFLLCRALFLYLSIKSKYLSMSFPSLFLHDPWYWPEQKESLPSQEVTCCLPPDWDLPELNLCPDLLV